METTFYDIMNMAILSQESESLLSGLGRENRKAQHCLHGFGYPPNLIPVQSNKKLHMIPSRVLALEKLVNT